MQDRGSQGGPGGAPGQGGGEGKEFEDIEALQNRFKNLKTENDKLMTRKQEINKEMETARQQEVTKLSELQNTLYE